jgi:hypothetical protein
MLIGKSSSGGDAGHVQGDGNTSCCEDTPADSLWGRHDGFNCASNFLGKLEKKSVVVVSEPG